MAVAGIAHGIGFAVGSHGEFQVVALASVPVGQVGNIVLDCVVLGILFSQVLVHLPHGLDGLGSLEGGEAARAASLGVAVVHHRHRGGQAIYHDRVVAGVETVVVHLVNVYCPDYIEWELLVWLRCSK